MEMIDLVKYPSPAAIKMLLKELNTPGGARYFELDARNGEILESLRVNPQRSRLLRHRYALIFPRGDVGEWDDVELDRAIKRQIGDRL